MSSEKAHRLIEKERQITPGRAATMPAARRGGSGGGERIAYCKNDAGTGSTIVCYLDTDGTGQEITVNCSICGGSNLNAAAPRLQNGDWMTVVQIGGAWYSTWGFNVSQNC